MRKECGKTQQSIYKRLAKVNNPLNVYSKQFADGLKIHKDALIVVYGIGEKDDLKVEQPSLIGTKEVEFEKDNKEEKTATMKVIEILREQLEAERQSNERKDKIINDLNERLAETTKLLDQQQKLSMADKQKILLLEEQATQKRKRSFFDFFKKQDTK